VGERDRDWIERGEMDTEGAERGIEGYILDREGDRGIEREQREDTGRGMG
jgi:hypothetical protein